MSARRFVDREAFARTGPVIVVCTLALTATFVGVVGLVSGKAGGVVARFPLYVLAGAVVFVGALLVLEQSRHDGRTVLAGAALVGAVGFVLASLGTEGIVYALTYPDDVVASHLFVYLLSAAIIASGLGYWSVRNWRGVSRATKAHL